MVVNITPLGSYLLDKFVESLNSAVQIGLTRSFVADRSDQLLDGVADHSGVVGDSLPCGRVRRSSGQVLGGPVKALFNC